MENFFWKPFIALLSLLGIPLSIVFSSFWRFDSIKPSFSTPWVQKRLIEFGIIRWYDLPHLHSYIIHRRIDVEWQLELNSTYKQTKRTD